MRIISAIFQTSLKKITYFHVSLMNRRIMSYAYVRHEEGCDRFNFSFTFEFGQNNRQFNFNRSVSETVKDFASRIGTNVSKAIEKNKKKEKGHCVISVAIGNDLVSLLKDNVALPLDTKCGDIIREAGLQLIVCGKVYGIVFNPPWVNSLVLPDCILADFPVYPSKIELENASRDLSSFIWFISADNKCNRYVWTPVAEGFFYKPTINEIGLRLMLKCTPRARIGHDEGTFVDGPKVEAISPTVVEAGPGVCPFETRHRSTLEKVSEGCLRVVSYNILADTYVDSDFSRNVLYSYCPPYALAINYRKQLILKELIGYNADLICLQEVDAKIYEFDLNPVLSSLGFEGLFKKKGEGKINEGLACFFSSKKFKLILSSSILLGKELSTNPIFSKMYEDILASSGDSFLTQMANLPTTIQVTVLEVTEKGKALGKRIVVAGTHLYFHPLADNIRLLQIGMSLKYLEHIVELVSKDTEDKATLIVCGDFNSTPEFGVVRLLTCGKVNEDDPDWSSSKEVEVNDDKYIGGDEGSTAMKKDGNLLKFGLNLSHPFSLSSAYGEIPFTNYTSGFVGCLDYIFYSDDVLTVDQVVPLPSEEEVGQNVALPSVVFPSDHLAIVADLRSIKYLNKLYPEIRKFYHV